jgi:Zn-dependent metalloprotease
VVEAYARAGGKGERFPLTGNDWVLGKEISKSGTPLRWMYRPSKDGSSPDAWSSSLKRLDVHYSSGPNNRMFYFLAQGSNADKAGDYYSKYLVKSPAAMTGVGLDKAYRIWFKANTTKFTSSTNYADARAKMIEAAQELYGKSGKGDRRAAGVCGDQCGGGCGRSALSRHSRGESILSNRIRHLGGAPAIYGIGFGCSAWSPAFAGTT